MDEQQLRLMQLAQQQGQQQPTLADLMRLKQEEELRKQQQQFQLRDLLNVLRPTPPYVPTTNALGVRG